MLCTVHVYIQSNKAASSATLHYFKEKKTASQNFQKKTWEKLEKKLKNLEKFRNLNLKKYILKSKHKQRWHELTLSSQMVVL